MLKKKKRLTYYLGKPSRKFGTLISVRPSWRNISVGVSCKVGDHMY